MRAQIVDAFGPPSVFRKADLPKPHLLPNQVLIQVQATSVNPIDCKIRAGLVPEIAPAFPAVLHGDVAGMIVEVGSRVKGWKIGDEVYACAGGVKGRGGALAEFMAVDSASLALKPKSLSFAEAAALPLVAITAWEALFLKAKIGAGCRLLIQGGMGGVGHIAVQLAKWAKAHVTATVGSKEDMHCVRKLGADHAINFREESVESINPSDKQVATSGASETKPDRSAAVRPTKDHSREARPRSRIDMAKSQQANCHRFRARVNNFDVIFDTVGGKNLDLSFQVAALNATIVTTVARSTHDLTPMHQKGLSLHVVFMLLPLLHSLDLSYQGKILEKIAQLVDEGKLAPRIDSHVFSIGEIAKAHEYLESGKAKGKVVAIW